MIQKYPICPHRVRKVPKQFSWVDHRLVRDRYIEHVSHQAAALYLFLVTVANAQGLSYYSDPSIARRLSMDDHCLEQARQELIGVDLIAYKKPIYQVLAIDGHWQMAPPTTPSSAHPLSLSTIFKQIMEVPS